MRRFVLFAVLLFQVYIVHAQVRWDNEAGDSQWSNPINWVGNVVPLSTDDVLLDNSVFPGSYFVILPGGAVTVSLNSLTITPAGLNNITLTLPISNLNNPGLDITGTGDVLVLNNGAILQNSSGASGGSGISITNTFRINNGGHYIHNTNRSHSPILDQLSSVAGTESGEFEFDVPTGSTPISLSNPINRIFGNLTLSAFTNGTTTYIASGVNPCTIHGNLKINTGTTFSTSFSADINVNGNFIQSPSSTFNLQSSSNNNIVKVMGNISSQGIITKTGSGSPILELNGTSNQNINFTGSFTNNVTLNMNNASGATLLSSLTLPYNLQLTSGNIKTTSSFLLTMADNAIYTGGSSLSFVDGPMKKIGDDAFDFPIGVGTMYAPVGISGGSGAAITNEFTAEYKRANPRTLHSGNSKDPFFDHISYVEYWTLNSNTTSVTKNVKMFVHPYSFALVFNTTYPTRWNGIIWEFLDRTPAVSGIPSPPYQTGTITTSLIGSFGDFTLATPDIFAINPLPIKLISFNATKSTTNSSLLKWELAACCSDAARFEIEKSTDNRNFILFDKIIGSLTNRFYSIPDNRLGKGITYYRLKMIDDDGTITYSKTAAVINDETGVLITSLLPNPVQNNATLTLSAAKAMTINFIISDISGKTIKQWSAGIIAGSNTIPINIEGLSAGIYYITASGNNSKTVFRFVKQ